MIQKFPFAKSLLFGLAFLLSSAFHDLSANVSTCKQPSIKVAGPIETIFNYKNDRCDEYDVPDTPAMAFKDAQNMVHLFNGIAGSYMSVGPNLNNVKRDCKQPLYPKEYEDHSSPETMDNSKWFRCPWTNDGKIVFGLIHNEFHGWVNSEKYCPSRDENQCLYPNVTVSRSTDGGKTFKVVRDPAGKAILGIVTPYPYENDGGRLRKQRGVRAPTNILLVTSNGKLHYYLLASNRGGNAQKAGTCLYRSDDVSNPSRWRAWDGNEFSVIVNNTVYRNKNLKPREHVCTPVFKAPPSSWTYNTALKQYVAIVGVGGQNQDQEDGFGYVTSPDMIHWSEPKFLMKSNFKNFHASRRGSGVFGYTYPSLLDPQSPGLNFEYSGNRPFLYMTRFNPKMAGSTWRNRDLVRVPLHVSCD